MGLFDFLLSEDTKQKNRAFRFSPPMSLGYLQIRIGVNYYLLIIASLINAIIIDAYFVEQRKHLDQNNVKIKVDKSASNFFMRVGKDYSTPTLSILIIVQFGFYLYALNQLYKFQEYLVAILMGSILIYIVFNAFFVWGMNRID